MGNPIRVQVILLKKEFNEKETFELNLEGQKEARMETKNLTFQRKKKHHELKI